MRDGHGRKIDYLRISLTDRCNLRCIYCMPEEGVCQFGHDDMLTLEEVATLVRISTRIGIKSVRLTGGEPTVRKGLTGLVREIHSIPGIENISMTTNGILLPKMAGELAEAGLSRVNISLDTLDRDQFFFITRRDEYDKVIEGIDAALTAGFNPVKINAVAVRQLNQDFLGFAKLSIDRPLHVRFIEYMPVGTSTGVDGNGWGPNDVVSCEELRSIINERAVAEGIEPLQAIGEDGKPIGWGPAEYYAFPGAKGTVGFISPVSRHFCSSCNRLRLTADGKLRPCLFSDVEFDVKKALREDGEEAAYNVFLRALGEKPDEHHDKVGTERKMSQIGG